MNKPQQNWYRLFNKHLNFYLCFKTLRGLDYLKSKIDIFERNSKNLKAQDKNPVFIQINLFYNTTLNLFLTFLNLLPVF